MDELNKEITQAVSKTFYGFSQCLSLGLRKLKNKLILKKYILCCAAAVFICAAAFQILSNKTDISPMLLKYGSVFGAVSYVFLHLCVLGAPLYSEQEEFKNQFEKYLFVSKQSLPPLLQDKKQLTDRVTQFTFTANIPLTEWRKKSEELEQIFDREILNIENGASKKNFILKCLPVGYKFPELLEWSDKFISQKDGEIIIGEEPLGSVQFNLNKLPHVIAAGETGSGKSVLIRCMLWQLINQGARPYMIDFKGGVEFGIEYEQYGEVITERERALEVLDMLVEENAKRLKLFRESRVKNLGEYNKKFNQNLCRIVVVIDEIAEMMDKKGSSKDMKDIFEQLEGRLSTLARLSRATGINLILGVQRPDANVLPGQIKNNVPVRISGRFADASASQIVLGNADATQLPNIKGRFMYKLGADTVMFQAFLFEDDKVLKPLRIKRGKLLLEKETQKNKEKAPPDLQNKEETQSAPKKKKKKKKKKPQLEVMP